MVTLTARAGALLRSHQAARADAPLPRLTAVAGAFSIGASSPAMGDEIVCHAGTPVLLVANDAAAALGGQILTLRDLRNAPVLVIMPPTTPRAGRGRTLRVGGRARRTPMITLSRGPVLDAGLRARTRPLVMDVVPNGVSDLERAYCDACQQARPGAGSVQDGRYALCNACALEYALASAQGHAVTAGQFVRDKVFGETAAYLFRGTDAEEIPAKIGAIRSLLPSAARDQRNRRVNIRGNGAATVSQRAVIRLPRHRTA
jgi:hypothetical protein